MAQREPKVFCPLEGGRFDRSEFKVVDGVLIHEVEPRHRATDGVLLSTEAKGGIDVADLAFELPAEAEEGQ